MRRLEASKKPSITYGEDKTDLLYRPRKCRFMKPTKRLKEVSVDVDWEKEFDNAFTIGEWFFVGQDSTTGEGYLKWNKDLIRKTIAKEKEKLIKEVECCFYKGTDGVHLVVVDRVDMEAFSLLKAKVLKPKRNY